MESQEVIKLLWEHDHNIVQIMNSSMDSKAANERHRKSTAKLLKALLGGSQRRRKCSG